MAKSKKRTNIDGFRAVVKKLANRDSLYGGVQKLADLTGRTRPAVSRWGRTGIPFSFHDTLPKQVGLSKEEIWPEFFT